METISVIDLGKAQGKIETGIGFFDHMIDQLNSHAQIGVSLSVADREKSQAELVPFVGSALGREIRQLLSRNNISSGSSSRFGCPLDEALVFCDLTVVATPETPGSLGEFALAPYGKFPRTGREHVGQLETTRVHDFFEAVAKEAGLIIDLSKVQGDNAHHIIEASFKAFSRALRNLLDGVSTQQADSLYGIQSENYQASISLERTGSLSRKTKETSIDVQLAMDGGSKGVAIDTGVKTLDKFLSTLAVAAQMSLTIVCHGDLHIDDHHTSEDVAIALGQCLNQALGTKAGLNRMWSSACQDVEVVMDLSNRPCLTHNLTLDNGNEKVGDLSIEMFEHVLDSFVVNARMTVHVVESKAPQSLEDSLSWTAQALGKCLYFCSMVDQRRAGATASSKGTLSV